jgi:hypothetical protein
MSPEYNQIICRSEGQRDNPWFPSNSPNNSFGTTRRYKSFFGNAVALTRQPDKKGPRGNDFQPFEI